MDVNHVTAKFKSYTYQSHLEMSRNVERNLEGAFEPRNIDI